MTTPSKLAWHPREKQILRVLKESPETWFSANELAQTLNYSKATIQTYIPQLKDKGLLLYRKRRDDERIREVSEFAHRPATYVPPRGYDPDLHCRSWNRIHSILSQEGSLCVRGIERVHSVRYKKISYSVIACVLRRMHTLKMVQRTRVGDAGKKESIYAYSINPRFNSHACHNLDTQDVQGESP